MADLITMQKMKENQIHNSSYNAKRNAEKNGVYVCVDDEKKEFSFIALEKVQYNGITLCEYIDNLKKEYDEKINKLIESQAQLIEAINELSAHVDNLRFL